MALPVPPNTTCVIYRAGNAPPAAPDVASTQVYLRASFPRGAEPYEGAAASRSTHEMIVEKNVDIRDHYTGSGAFGVNMDSVYVLDQNGTRFKVVFVELIDRGNALERKRCYLDRQAVTWPSDHL